jgi:hypothetical protein
VYAFSRDVTMERTVSSVSCRGGVVCATASPASMAAAATPAQASLAMDRIGVPL